MRNITMGKKEINQISIFEKLIPKEISQDAAAKILGITSQQIRNKFVLQKISQNIYILFKNKN